VKHAFLCSEVLASYFDWIDSVDAVHLKHLSLVIETHEREVVKW